MSLPNSTALYLSRALADLRLVVPPGSRMELQLVDGQKYWITEVIEEWTDAFKIITEPEGLPILVMRSAVRTVTPDPNRSGAGP